MKGKATIAVSCAAAAALALCLMGCSANRSSSESAPQQEPQSAAGGAAQQEQQVASGSGITEPYVEVDGRTYTADEWNEIIEGNSLAAESYVGKQVTLIAPVSQVRKDGSLPYGNTGLYKCPVGYITSSLRGSTFYVDIPEQYKDLVTTLKADMLGGDMVKVTGTITDASLGFSLINGPVDGIPNSGPITIEKLS